MQRSTVNDLIREGDAFLRSFGFRLPPFAYWTPEEMAINDHKVIVERGMGWDVTDYGQGRFDEMGLFLFTLRNGQVKDIEARRGMLYAEKLLISRKDQLSPMHRHMLKAEDIINRGGGKLILELFAGQPDGSIDRESDVSVPVDGQSKTLPAGGKLSLEPGESVTLLPGVWHAFWGEGGDVLIGEVSTVNDDKTDNEFEMDIGRFANVEEDENPIHLLVSDYESYLQ
ncbi:D-lyxose/D-mannose family sugar isomerase [Phaeobacter inhibens]|uniref:D-lyxose/D-mannose family sugar isomerase n=1 Tax=Phaeobacter inhibens TaxID=221822 RepID=UPI0001633359|nr:D-lyxose/D-mannose family sugar isomerase [Phaeobacter inhibens]AFO91636.1 hypothetical protein PGA1_c19450 [Phaeobacter inhibens DSM 17395]AUQ46304.1 ABC-type sugar transport system, auxiliary component [Phaeobacter inhibens]AXT23026.1 D-lyxose/D-mannose family sugar isomerase [Phaeobacter inhibens]